MFVVYISKDEKACIVADDWEMRNGKIRFRRTNREKSEVVAIFNMDSIIGFDDLREVDGMFEL